jgi:hypothetical protein
MLADPRDIICQGSSTLIDRLRQRRVQSDAGETHLGNSYVVLAQDLNHPIPYARRFPQTRDHNDGGLSSGVARTDLDAHRGVVSPGRPTPCPDEVCPLAITPSIPSP